MGKVPESIRETFHEWVGKQLLLVSANNTNSTDKNKNAMICFDQLLIPAWSLFRFPLFSNKQVTWLRKYTFLWRHTILMTSGIGPFPCQPCKLCNWLCKPPWACRPSRGYKISMILLLNINMQHLFLSQSTHFHYKCRWDRWLQAWR